MPNFDCVGRDGVTRTFRYEYDKDQFQDEWNFRVFSVPAPASGEFFDLSVAKIVDDMVRVIAVAHHNEPAYVAKGIPEALLPIVKQVLNKQVISSPTGGQAGNVYRTPAATKVWERLCASGKATYDAPADIFRLA